MARVQAEKLGLIWRVIVDVAIIALLVFAVYNGTQVRENSRNIRQVVVRVEGIATDNTKALCAVKGDYQRRVDLTENFLKDHPQGIPGLTAESLKVNLINQQRTIHALRFVHCPPPTKVAPD